MDIAMASRNAGLLATVGRAWNAECGKYPNRTSGADRRNPAVRFP